MDVTPLIRRDQNIIQSYKDGELKISGARYTHPVIVTFDKVHDWSGVIDAAQFERLKNETDILLIGLKGEVPFLTPQQRSAFKDMGLSVDVMAAGAACRTFNVLTAEGRRVAAALVC
jgi:uncharacterized protein